MFCYSSHTSSSFVCVLFLRKGLCQFRLDTPQTLDPSAFVSLGFRVYSVTPVSCFIWLDCFLRCEVYIEVPFSFLPVALHLSEDRLSAIGVAFESWPKITQWYYIFIFNCSFYIVCGSITVLCICLLILWPCWADSFVEFLETVWDFVSRQLCYLQVDSVLFFLPDIHVIYLFSQYWGSNPGLGRQALYCLNCAPALLLLLCFLR